MASAQDVRRRIATVMIPVANIVTAQGAGGALRQVIEIAIDGYGRMPSAKAVAARHLQRQGGSIDDAMSSIIDHHIRPRLRPRICHQHRRPGCVAGSRYPPISPASPLCRFAWLPRFAHLRGYDLDDHRVRTALVMCLMGGEQVAKHIARGNPANVAYGGGDCARVRSRARQAGRRRSDHRPCCSDRRQEPGFGDRQARSTDGRGRQCGDGWLRDLPDRPIRDR